MLANPNLAPFEVLDKPLEHKDWILIDHLMVIHKVKESDYVESEPATSVLNMARTLACNYMPEGPHARSVVLVKDGPGTQKPSVREIRTARVTAPHIEFCKRHPGEIEYAVKKLLADVGMKEKLFLVTGAKWGHEESSPGSPGTLRVIPRRQTAAAFERILEDHGVASFRSEVVDYLYLGGIRGSVHVAFLATPLRSDAKRRRLTDAALEKKKRKRQRDPGSAAEEGSVEPETWDGSGAD
ncbi:hypothetical protein Q5P01_010566 [Channa striata]|uniref:Uncharacterized protein n=1 Tax=Channa striata TaxID=64152 RepID=A0AA88N014_CHASR|nr:hypothetical protein Q5P01_010566 [Channa striata]